MKRGMRSAAWFLIVLFLFLSLSACRTDDDPAVAPKRLLWAVGARLPAAEDFFDALPEGASVSFANSDVFADLKLGENEVQLIYRPEKGRKKTLKAVLELTVDNEPPVISGVKDIIAYVGEGVSYRSGIAVSDNCGGEILLEVNSTAVDTAREGVYPVIYSATDLAGNQAQAQANVHVYLEKITSEMLYAEIDPLIDSLGLRSLTKEQQVRAIFDYVHTGAKIVYIDTSDKTDWIRAAYFCLRDRHGDCFSFFSLSKAFFERLGIENMDIQRLPGYTDDTHYWSLVNIGGSGNAARWYHYDATRLRDVSGSGALLTDRQVDAFSRIRKDFYLYDRSRYPATDTTEITPRPDL